MLAVDDVLMSPVRVMFRDRISAANTMNVPNILNAVAGACEITSRGPERG